MDLTQKKCVACEGDAVPLNKADTMAMLKHVSGWAPAEDGRSILKQFKFHDFVQAMEFANKVAPIAEREGHHPDLHISWGKVVVELSTHAIKGLSENDFILAAKIDQAH
ncbi:MAG: 4a-hydroxytetrahydrobiopterin dehydratase [Candidatus Paceibacterota bacterium]